MKKLFVIVMLGLSVASCGDGIARANRVNNFMACINKMRDGHDVSKVKEVCGTLQDAETGYQQLPDHRRD